MRDVTKTKEYQRFVLARDFIHDNKDNFKAGARIPQSTVADHFGIPFPNVTAKGLSQTEIAQKIRAYDCARLAWSCRINRILAQRGLYMTAQGGKGTHYCISTKKQAKAKVLSFKIDAERKLARANELQTGITKYKSVYGKVSDAKLAVISPTYTTALAHEL